MTDKIVLKIDDLGYTYATGSTALEHVSFEVREGEFIAIIGQNGAGKSTLLKNITGLLTPTEGDIYVNGVNTKELGVAAISRQVGFVLQNPDRQLFANTVFDEVAFGLRNAKVPEDEIKRRVLETLESVGLSDKTEEFPPALSKGDRAKVVVASVIVMRANIIILDEPTSGQDYKGCYQIMEIAKRLNGEGHTVIFVTHHMPLVSEFSERTIVMSRKHVLLDGPSHDVFEHVALLETTNIRPPQITRFGTMLEEKIPISGTMLSVAELGDALLQAKQAAR